MLLSQSRLANNIASMPNNETWRRKREHRKAQGFLRKHSVLPYSSYCYTICYGVRGLRVQYCAIKNKTETRSLNAHGRKPRGRPRFFFFLLRFSGVWSRRWSWMYRFSCDCFALLPLPLDVLRLKIDWPVPRTSVPKEWFHVLRNVGPSCAAIVPAICPRYVAILSMAYTCTLFCATFLMREH